MAITPIVLRNVLDGGVWQKFPTYNWNNADKNTVAGSLAPAPNANAEAYYYFAFPQLAMKTKIISAKLVFTTVLAYPVSVTFSVQRVIVPWSDTKITFNTRPATDPTVYSLNKLPTAAGTTWSIDVTGLFQTVANGGVYYGIRVLPNTTAPLNSIWSPGAPQVNLRPYLEISWADNPLAPTQLYPSSGRAVSSPKPTVSCNFSDLNGDTTMSAMQVQINSTDVWTAPSFDSGAVTVSIPQLDLSTTSFVGLTNGQTLYWRARVCDGAGLWSDWSKSTTLSYFTKGTLALVNPTSGVESRRNLMWTRGITSWTQDSSTPAVFGAAAVVATGNPDDNGAFLRWTITTAGATSAAAFNLGSGAANTLPVVAGQVYQAQVQVRTSTDKQWYPQIQFYNAAGALLNTRPGVTIDSIANIWAQASAPFAIAPPLAVRARVSIVFNNEPTDPNWLVGNQVDIASGLFEKTNTMQDFFDGASPSTNELAFTWVGTAGSSASIGTGAVVNDATPPITWTLTGRTQKAFQVLVLPSDGWSRVFDSGKITSAATLFTLPQSALPSNNRSYTLILRVWDTIDREQTAGDTIFYEVEKIFRLTYSSVIAPVTALMGKFHPVFPWVTLSWTIASQPDKWNIYRDGKLIAVYDGTQLYQSGLTYSFTDRGVSPRKQTQWTVIPVINGVGGANNPSLYGSVRPISTILSDLSGNNAVVIMNPKNDAHLTSNSSVYTPAGASSPVLITQNKTGYQGKVTGRLATIGSFSAEYFRDNFKKLKDNDGQLLMLTLINETFQVFIKDATFKAVAKTEEVVYDVEFEFYQTDYIPGIS